MKQLELNQDNTFKSKNLGSDHYRDICMKNHYDKLEHYGKKKLKVKEMAIHNDYIVNNIKQ